MKINCKMNSLMVISTKVVLISTGQQYTKQCWMSIQIRYRSCNVLVPNSGSWYQRYQMLVSVMKTVPFLYRHVYWAGYSRHKDKTLVFIGILDHLWITKNAFMVCFFASRSLIQFVQYTIPPPAASVIGWLFILGYTDCNTVPTWWV